MLIIKILEEEFFDNEKQEFITSKGHELKFEHSLVSLSKWESIHEKAFLGGAEHTKDEMRSYVECMLVSSPEHIENPIMYLNGDHYKKIQDYISKKSSATWFPEVKAPGPREIVTSELIYYWMFSAQIPKECEEWHLNRLITLIRVFGAKNQKPKKMSRASVAQQQRELNAQRRAQYGTSG